MTKIIKNNLGKPTSIWIDTTPVTNYPELKDNVETDVVIVGGGIAGLMSAYFMKEEGLRVVVLEGSEIATGTTGYTTAKVTSAHGFIYKYLIDKFGKQKAQIYADANQTAISKIADLVNELNINCDFRRMPAYTYAMSKNQDARINDEVRAAKTLGLPTSMVSHAPLPYTTSEAVCFSDQAQFHPRKFLLKIASEIDKDDSHIFEKTKAIGIKDGIPCRVATDRYVVTAKKVVVATNLPFYDPHNFFVKMTGRQSFTIGAKIEGTLPLGVFYGPEKNHDFHSLRTQQINEKEELLLVGGKLHNGGGNIDMAKQYEHLSKWTKTNFNLNSIRYHWTTSDSESFDRVPIIGRLSTKSENIFVVTGFNGWGMTHSTVAAMILADEVRGKRHPWSDLYSPERFSDFSKSPKNINDPMDNNSKEGKTNRNLDKLKPGNAKILKIDGSETAVYKDENGDIHAISATCTHMGCTVGWNKKAKSWDCPCHGSRFSFEGKVIHGPATKDLPSVSI